MPITLQIVHTNDFIRSNSKGEYDAQETRRVLGEIAKSCIESGVNCALIDIRKARSNMTLEDLYELALTFREMGFRKNHRVAILYSAQAGEKVEFFAMQPGQRAEFFAMCASDAGWNVEAFDTYEDAMEWFGAAQPVVKHEH